MKKRIAAFLLVLLAAIAFSQPQTGGFGIGGNAGRLGPSFSQYAFFEFAPASGQGMTAACTCANPTGVRGEAMTFTRASSATCSKRGLATTSIANGDIVTCASDQSRVEPSVSSLGLRVEGARTNDVLRSQELDNAAWSAASSGVAVPTVTADQAVAPDGTTTADRLQIPATVNPQYSYVFQGGLSAVQRATSLYVKGNGTSGTINLLSGSTPNDCTLCTYNSTTWTRCSLVSAGATATFLFIGNDSNSAVCGTASRGAQDVFVWGTQAEAGAYATSYIHTVAAAVTRNADRGHFALASTPKGVDGLYSMSATLETLNNVNRTWEALIITASGGPPYVSLLSNVAQNRCESFNVSPLTATGTASGPSGRFTCWNDGTNEQGISNGAAFSGPVPGFRSGVGINRVGVTTASAGYEVDGIITGVCVDPSPSRCR